MRVPLYHRFFGYYPVRVAAKDRTRLKNLLFTARITAYEESDGVFFVPRQKRKALADAAVRARLSLSWGKLLGAPRLFLCNRHRIGIPIGLLFAALLLFFGSNTVWRLEISGNTTVTDAQIEEALALADYGVGASTRREGYDDLIASVRLSHPLIAWMSIYTEGTTAYVRVIEKEGAKEEALTKTPCHLAASEDALILQMALTHGTAVVRVGSVVKKGDLLALGLVSGAHEDHVLAAEGSVIGRVKEVVSTEIPYVQTEKTEIARKTLDFSLIFFRKPLFFFKKTNKNELNYVIIERKEYFSLFGVRLPFGYFVREAILYEETPITLTPAEAIKEGIGALDAQIRRTVGDGELLSRQMRVEETNGACRLYATVEYTKNIAVPVPFSVE